MSTNENNPTITIEGEQYLFNDLSDPVKNLVMIYNEWNNDLAAQRRGIFKLELAIKALTTEIINQISNEKASKAKIVLNNFPETE
jgi:hypothetical protein